MALPATQITAITEKFYYPKLRDGVYDSNPLIARLARPGKKLMVDGGSQITFPIISSKPGSGGYFSDFEALDTSPTDNLTSVILDWKQIHEPIKISRLEEIKNSGAAAKLKLVAAKMQVAELNIKENLALGLYSDGTAATGALTTKQLTGLLAILSTSSTYGSIAVADMAEWIAVSNNNSGTNRPLSIGLMQNTWGQCQFDNEKPSVIVGKQVFYDEYYALMQPHQRLVSKDMDSLGFSGIIEFNGAPVLPDDHATANEAYFLNENFLFLAVAKGEDLRFDKIDKLETQAASVGRIFWAGNLVCNGRRYQGILDDITTS